MKKQIMVWADDYAQNDAISEGIRCAIRARRINAVSCLTTAPSWMRAGAALRQMQSDCLVGLHLNLTWGQASSIAWQKHYGLLFKALPIIILASYLKRLNPQILMAECRAQLELFRRVMGRDPDFIDGHQHVHQLPVVRDVLCALYQNEQLTSFVRSTVSGVQKTGFPKAQLIACLGGVTCKRILQAFGIPINTSFSGVYPFRCAPRYRHYFKHFLSASEDRGLIMCHPGIVSSDTHDPLHASRHHELAYLMSAAFLDDLDAYAFTLHVSGKQVTL